MNKINKQTLTISDPVASHVEPECSVAPVEFFRNYFIHHRHIQVDGVVKKQRVDWTLYTKELSLNFSLKTNVHFLHWQPHVLLHYLVKHWCQKTSKYCDQRKITKRRSWGVVGFLIINFGRASNYLLNHVIPVSFIVSRQRLRSAQQNTLVVPRYRLTTYGRRAFSVAGPTAWNSLSVAFRHPTISDACFRRHLKTVLFTQQRRHHSV